MGVGLVAIAALLALGVTGDRIDGLLDAAGVELGAVQNQIETPATGQGAPSSGTGGDEASSDPFYEGCDTISGKCADGSTYVGLHHETGLPMYAQPVRSENWHHYTRDADDRYFYLDTPADDVDDGRSNTDALLARKGELNGAYDVAELCARLDTGGHDWYLPAYKEVRSFWNNTGVQPDWLQTTTGSYGTEYASSTEVDCAAQPSFNHSQTIICFEDHRYQMSVQFHQSLGPTLVYSPKVNTLNVVCVRQHGSPSG